MSHVESSGKSEGWEQVIADSKAMLARVEAKANRLKTSIVTLQEAKDAGEPWPGTPTTESATQN